MNMMAKETSEERKKRFKSMTSNERKTLIREKMKVQGLKEGSGVPGKDLSSYDRDEIWEMIQVTSCFAEMQTKPSTIEAKTPNKKKSLIAWILIAMALVGVTVLYHKQYPSPGTRSELSVEGMFAD